MITPDEAEKLRRFVVFVCYIYVEAWLSCPSAADAAYNDLEMIKTLVSYTKTDPEVAEVVLTAFARHTWYLSAELIPMTLVSDKVHAETKVQIADRLLSVDKESLTLGKPKLPSVPCDAGIEDVTLDGLVGTQSHLVFDCLKIDMSFLSKCPPWNGHPDFERLAAFVRNLRVTNDAAERGVRLVTDYIGCLTRSDENRQHLLQVVENHRKVFPDSRKSVLEKGGTV